MSLTAKMRLDFLIVGMVMLGGLVTEESGLGKTMQPGCVKSPFPEH